MNFQLELSTDQWIALVGAGGAVLTPIVVGLSAIVFARRQTRSEQLLGVRLGYYQELAPELNRLMCYLTFIGTWRDDSPLDIVMLKRRLDSRFACALPLFSEEVGTAYQALMQKTFTTFGLWGQDARIRSSAYRRRQAWKRLDLEWNPDWDECFELEDDAPISASSLADYRHAYDRLVGALVHDLSLSRARDRYTTAPVSLNASAPPRESIPGREPGEPA